MNTPAPQSEHRKGERPFQGTCQTWVWALHPGPGDFSAVINFVELEHSERDLLLLMLLLLWAGEILLLLLFPTTTTQPQNQMKGALFLNVVVRQGPAVFQLLSCKDQALLIRWNPFLVLDLCLHIVDGVITFHLESKKRVGAQH